MYICMPHIYIYIYIYIYTYIHTYHPRHAIFPGCVCTFPAFHGNSGKTRAVISSTATNINLIKQRVNAMIPCWGMGKRVRLL